MYAEIEIIKQVVCSKTRVMLYATFIEEYGGWIQHLDSVGGIWGAGGEEVGAGREMVIAKKHVARLHKELEYELTTSHHK